MSHALEACALNEGLHVPKRRIELPHLSEVFPQMGDLDGIVCIGGLRPGH